MKLDQKPLHNTIQQCIDYEILEVMAETNKSFSNSIQISMVWIINNNSVQKIDFS